MTAPLDHTVATLAAAYCARIDAAHPGALTGLYLVGSIALDDYRPGTSDVDFIAVLDHALSRDSITALHRGLQEAIGSPHFDGIYVDAASLGRDPRTIEPGFSVIDGRVRGPDREERHPVTWLTLARHGIAIRGPAPSPDWIWTDLGAAQVHARDNLRSYWQRRSDWHHIQCAASAPLADETVVWIVLGVGRLHAMITKGLLLSKGQAADYQRAAFPAHNAIIAEAAALRLGLPVATPFSTAALRYAAMLDFLDAVIADALAWNVSSKSGPHFCDSET